MSWSFLLTSLIVVASPGTCVLYTLAAALSRGGRASIAAALGCTLGIVPHMIAAILGLAAVLHTSALAFAALKWCGCSICSTCPGRLCARPARWLSRAGSRRARTGV
jgi:threonine/homoserine/homoserine lactone efflux protein